ncbi:hypothetical protein Ciccas_005142 [Cichlidogyrus casuarinus]|uniref:Uncharacterized protein n=1 Tax=Cichlidogyrus casuarinus TaxID=1844966 RepID=A0ABD2Q9Y1_9PLAT
MRKLTIISPACGAGMRCKQAVRDLVRAKWDCYLHDVEKQQHPSQKLQDEKLGEQQRPAWEILLPAK